MGGHEPNPVEMIKSKMSPAIYNIIVFKRPPFPSPLVWMDSIYTPPQPQQECYIYTYDRYSIFWKINVLCKVLGYFNGH